MWSMLKSKSADYAGDGAMDRRWRMSSTVSRSRSVKERGFEGAPTRGPCQPDIIPAYQVTWLAMASSSQSESCRVEDRGRCHPTRVADSAGYPSLRWRWIRSVLQGGGSFGFSVVSWFLEFCWFDISSFDCEPQCSLL
ncbi:hypothetical protein N7465_011216 [Penicillium sp. CMV-2018d]|nr:hypothetical protein N7465_011216 [Penicillium sp. CMV-2018d]